MQQVSKRQQIKWQTGVEALQEVGAPVLSEARLVAWGMLERWLPVYRSSY